MAGDPHLLREGELVFSDTGIFDISYWRKLGLEPPFNATMGMIVSIQVKESPVPAYIFSVLTPGGVVRVPDEALLVTTISHG